MDEMMEGRNESLSQRRGTLSERRAHAQLLGPESKESRPESLSHLKPTCGRLWEFKSARHGDGGQGRDPWVD